jgi:O-antigen/teichoic acid export membrane protein
MGVESYGLIGFFMSLQAILIVLDFGLGATTTREIARTAAFSEKNGETYKIVRTLEYVYYTLAIAIATMICVLSYSIANKWINNAKLETITIQLAIIIFGLTLAVRWPISLYLGVLRGLENQVLANLIETTTVILKGVGAVLVLILISSTITYFLLWQAIIVFCELIFMRWITWRKLPKSDCRFRSFNVDILKQLWHFSARVSLISIFAIILKQIDKLIISKMLPLHQLGYYTTSSVLVVGIFTFCNPINVAVYPRLSLLYLKNDMLELGNIYRTSSQMVAFLVSPLASIMFYFAYPILLFWTNSIDIAENTHYVLSILAMATMINCMMQIPYSLQLSSGLIWIPFWNNFISVLLLAPTTYILILYFGIIGGPIAWMLFNMLYYLIVPQVMHRYILKEYLKSWIFNDTLPFMLLSLAIIGVIYLINSHLGNGNFIPMIIWIFVGGFIYATICLIFYKSLRNTIKKFIGTNKELIFMINHKIKKLRRST